MGGKSVKQVLNVVTFGAYGVGEKAVSGVGNMLGGGKGASSSSVPASVPAAAATQQKQAQESMTTGEPFVRRPKGSRGGAVTQTVFTSPLGFSGMANVARKVLLGQ